MKLHAAMIIAIPALAYLQGNDEVVLKNGERISGTIEDLSYDKVKVSIEEDEKKTIKEVASDDAVSITFGSKTADFETAEGYYLDGNYQAAVKELEKIKDSVKKERPVVYQLLLKEIAESYLGLGDYKGAIQAYKRLRDEVQKSYYILESYDRTYECYSRLGDAAGVDATLKELQDAGARAGKKAWSVRAESLQAQIVESKGKIDEALKMYSRNEESDEIAKLGVIRCLYKTKKQKQAFEKANDVFQKARNKEKSFGQRVLAYAAMVIGAEMESSGKNADACAWYLRPIVELKIQPSDEHMECARGALRTAVAIAKSLIASDKEKTKEYVKVGNDMLISLSRSYKNLADLDALKKDLEDISNKIR